MCSEFKHQIYFNTPIGTTEIIGTEEGLESIKLIDYYRQNCEVPKALETCVTQLNEYFNKQRQIFDLKLNPKGTPFQLGVWKFLQTIPYGSVISYKEQAIKMGDVHAIRAVAAANAHNPLWIVVPCHRVIGSDGDLIGYAGGLWRKEWLLKHEGALTQTSLFE
ncbi:MAG: methylated-DNA--[protein]-cysteine S-methyltransferase [Bacteroidetes bacterium]|jgi:methylated-DNA-[protein]-cysteine S-methyltransferase|nr:methylated-DNA--[protein]-cysteine S-methyltransferase [Bacteroidota bacterium]